MVGTPAARNVVAFVGENENNILRAVSIEFMDLLAPRGYVGHVVDLNDPDWLTKFGALVGDGIAFAWGCAGIGSGLANEAGNIWDQIKVPFLSVHADHPSQAPSNHSAPSTYAANCYFFSEHLEVQRRYVRSPQLAMSLPMGTLPNVLCDERPWSQREHRMVYVKTGQDPRVFSNTWTTWPRRIRAVVEDAASAALARGTGDLSQVVADSFEASGIAFGEHVSLYFSVFSQVDHYVRSIHSSALVETLCRLPVDIVGRGWDHIDRSNARARFHPAMDGSLLKGLYANTQILVNSTPNFGSGLHERVTDGFAAKAVVLSDRNAYAREHLDRLPSFIGFEWTDPSWPDQVIGAFEDPTDFSGALAPAFDFVERAYSPLAFVNAMVEAAEAVRFATATARFQPNARF